MLVARRDNNYWTMFHQSDGKKIRFSFDADAPTPTKASAPELVDIKITDFCPYKCAFCYQNSTSKGAHASIKYLDILAHALGTLEVFEVAIGGGEPTLHYYFPDILRSFNRAGINANFTTRNLQWLHSTKERDTILKECSAIGFSVQGAPEVDNIAALLNVHNVERGRATLHVVLGAHYAYAIKEILKAANYHNLNVLLLGFKPNGRGSTFKQLETFTFEDLTSLPEDFWFTNCLAIDTCLAAQWATQMQDYGISPKLYTTEEGKFSCYIDAVQRTIGPSSYCADAEMLPLPEPTYTAIKKAFATF